MLWNFSTLYCTVTPNRKDDQRIPSKNLQFLFKKWEALGLDVAIFLKESTQMKKSSLLELKNTD